MRFWSRVRGSKVLLLAALATASCRGCERKSAAPPTATLSIDSGVSASPIAADAGAKAAGQSRMLLLRLDSELVPLGCYDARKKAMGPGKDCIDLVTADPKVRILQSDEAARVQPQTIGVVPATLAFEASGASPAGFRLDLPCAKDADEKRKPPCAGPEGDDGGHALWPAGAFDPSFRIIPRPKPIVAVEVTDASADATPEPPSPPPTSDATAVPGPIIHQLEALLRKHGFKKMPAIDLYQRVKVDLDGDHADDTVLCVRVSMGGLTSEDYDEEHMELPGQFFYLFLRTPKGYVRMRLPDGKAMVGIDADAEIRAVMDLDADGSAELWLHNTYYEGEAWMLARWRAHHWEIIDSFSDGA